MTAPVLLAGILQAIPDDVSAPPIDSGADAHANFQTVLEQVHESCEDDSKTDDPQSSGDPKQQKDSDPSATLAVPLQVTPPAEATRLILPFTTTFTMRGDGDAAASPDDTAPKDTSASAGDPVATQDSTTAAADSKVAPSTVATTSAPLDLPSFSLESETKTNSASRATQPKSHAKSRATSHVILTESAPARTVTTPLDPSAPVLPVKISTTLDQVATPVRTSLTVDEAPDAVIASTSTVDRAGFILADSRADSRTDSRKAAYQYHSSREADPAAAIPRSNVPQHQKVTDFTATIPVPVPVTEAVEPLRLIHALAPSNTPWRDAPVAQDSSVTSPTDSKGVMPPVVEQVDDTTAAPPAGTIAFAARLTPAEETPAPTSILTPDASRPADSQSRVQTVLQSANPASAKQIASDADLPADAHGGDSGSQPDKEKMHDRFARPALVPPQMPATFPDQPAAAVSSHPPAGTLSPAARLDQVQETPAPAPNSNHDITIRIPDASNDQGTAVRFVERAGEVHVSVRTGDADMAQTLRGGLHDLVNRLEDSGIRTQVWQPGTDTATSQNDSHHPFADPDGSNGRQHSPGSNSQQESRQHNRPRWVEELEGSIGNPNFKETTQLLWQA